MDLDWQQLVAALIAAFVGWLNRKPIIAAVSKLGADTPAAATDLSPQVAAVQTLIDHFGATSNKAGLCAAKSAGRALWGEGEPAIMVVPPKTEGAA